MPSISLAFLVDDSMAAMRDACSLQLFSISALYSVEARLNSDRFCSSSARSGPSISYWSSRPPASASFSRDCRGDGELEGG